MLFFFNDTATTEIYTLSLHDALPICDARLRGRVRLQGFPEHPRSGDGDSDVARDQGRRRGFPDRRLPVTRLQDRKSTRLNSSHSQISYAVFCLKKKKNNEILTILLTT